MGIRGYTIAVSGKGGVGKTFLSSFLTRYFSTHRSVLAIDADPDSNLPMGLGVDEYQTVGDAREQLLDIRNITRDDQEDRMAIFKRRIHEVVFEDDKFDLLVMGRSEGEGCYCAVNHILRQAIDGLSKSYELVIIDCEPGLEHFSRRTAHDVNLLVVVIDSSRKGIITAKRIKGLSQELHIIFDRIFVVANRITPANLKILKDGTRGSDIEIRGSIPFDPELEELDTRGSSIFDLGKDSPAYQAAHSVAEQIEAEMERMGSEL